MKMYKYILMTLITLILLGWSCSASAQQDSDSVRELLEERDQQIKELVGPEGTEYTQQQRDELKDIINGIIDYEAMGSYALADTYEELSEEERAEFIDLFSTIIRDQSLNKLDIYRADIEYNSIEVDDGQAKVNILAVLEDVRTPVIYDMEYREANDQWVITDMTIDDVSTAGSYRRQFQSMLQKGGFDFLMERLRKRAAR